VGPRHRVPERRHGEDLPGLRRRGEPAAPLGRHAVQPAAAGGAVAPPAVLGAGQQHADPEEAHPAAEPDALLVTSPRGSYTRHQVGMNFLW